MLKIMKHRLAGFTVMEVLIVMVVLGILSALVYNAFTGSQERAYFERAKTELTTMSNALKLYIAKYNDYPPEENRALPAGMKEFIAGSEQNSAWPAGPWPNSTYDYDRWLIAGDTEDTYQISIRFCPAGASNVNQCRFPREDWAKDFGVDSAVYYCLKGSCRSSATQPATYPGYCVNCPGNKAIGT